MKSAKILTQDMLMISIIRQLLRQRLTKRNSLDVLGINISSALELYHNHVTKKQVKGLF